MTDKELREIRRRFRPNKSNITAIKGVIVDKDKTIKSYINQSMINTISDDCEMLLSIMKKVLSGGIGTNLIDLEYGSSEIIDNENHRFLMDIRNSNLQNEDALNYFYGKIIESVHLEDSFAILIASDNYDVFSYDESGERKEDSDTVFSYIICAVCPIKNSSSGLFYSDFDNSFRSTEAHMLLSKPELGFMFPTFDDRCANIYKAQLYTKNVADVHSEFIANIFNLPSPLASTEQKDSFDNCLKETLEEDCNFDVVRSVHDQISEMVTEHKTAKQEEPLKLSKNTFKNVLSNCGIEEAKVEKFENKFEECFGRNAEISPNTIIDVKKFEVNTPYVTIKVDPERSDLITTQIINGSRYILIRANDNVEVNGVNIDIK